MHTKTFIAFFVKSLFDPSESQFSVEEDFLLLKVFISLLNSFKYFSAGAACTEIVSALNKSKTRKNICMLLRELLFKVYLRFFQNQLLRQTSFKKAAFWLFIYIFYKKKFSGVVLILLFLQKVLF